MLTKPLIQTAWPLQRERGLATPARTGGLLKSPPCAFLFAAALFVVPATFAQAQAQPQATRPGYVGSDTCQGCHEDIFKTWTRNVHRRVETARKYKYEGYACESCHGPGEKHVETQNRADIINPDRQNPDKADQNCLKCHLNQPTHVGRVSGGHARGQVPCVSCHTMHQGMDPLRPRKAAQVNELCASCHNSVWAEFQRPHRHPLPEGAMSCIDCHNPHSSLIPGRNMRLVAGNEPNCLRCHTNLRGPFVYEHAPVKLEGCQTCHMPHGSANPRMLTRHEVRFVCMECHTNATVPVRGGAQSNGAGKVEAIGGIPPAFHNLRNPRFQNCTICHVKIHGSYVDPTLER